VGPGKFKNGLGQIRQPASTGFENNASVQFMGGNCVFIQTHSHQGGLVLEAPSRQKEGQGHRGSNKPNLSSLIHCQGVNPTHWESDGTGNKGQTVLSSRCPCFVYSCCGREVCKGVCICECLCVYPSQVDF